MKFSFNFGITLDVETKNFMLFPLPSIAINFDRGHNHSITIAWLVFAVDFGFYRYR